MAEYLEKAGFEPNKPLFQTVHKKQPTGWLMSRSEAYRIIRRRALAAGILLRCAVIRFGLPGLLETAQKIAAHESPRTTKLCDRTDDQLALDEIEKISVEKRISPIRASALLLSYLRAAWDAKFADRGLPFNDQEITVTVPASFDAAAQRLTLDAAQEAGFPESVRLLEEPQAVLAHQLQRRDGRGRSHVRVAIAVAADPGAEGQQRGDVEPTPRREAPQAGRHARLGLGDRLRAPRRRGRSNGLEVTGGLAVARVRRIDGKDLLRHASNVARLGVRPQARRGCGRSLSVDVSERSAADIQDIALV